MAEAKADPALIGNLLLDMKEMLKLQLSEMELIQSMYPTPDEFTMYGDNIIEYITEFIEGKCSSLPSRIDFSLNLLIDGNKIEMCVSLPLDYPATDPELYIRSDALCRAQQTRINNEINSYVSKLEKVMRICLAITWLQEHAPSFFTPLEKPNSSSESKSRRKPRPKPIPKKTFTRYWIYSHHIYNTNKRKSIVDLAHENNITGFCLPGKPGIICIEGLESDCEDWWCQIRNLNWQKITCKKIEKEQIDIEASIDPLRKFTGFQEIAFQTNKTKNFGHMDMGDFLKYLNEHDAGYAFEVYFGMDGKKSKN